MSRRTLFGHPIGLTFLALTEVWERFSFYGISSLVLLYMLDHLLNPAGALGVTGLSSFRHAIEAITGPLSDQAFASQTLGLFTGLVYFTPIFGGILADRWLGRKPTVVLGILLLGFGNVTLSIESSFLVGLLLIIAGTGCLKGNISAQVGKLYAPDEESQRTQAFVIFSAAINTGALLGPLACGILAARANWEAGFMVASIMMVVALATYIAGSRYIPSETKEKRRAERQPLTKHDWGTIAVLLGLMLLATLPLAAYYQEFNVVQLFIREAVDRDLLGWSVPTASFISLDGFFGVLLVPLLIAAWRKLSVLNREPSDAGKLAIGCTLIGLANLVFALAAARAQGGHPVGMVWPLIFFGVNALGFLCCWPTLLAVFSRAAPTQVNSTFMGVLYLTLFFANLLVGRLAGFWLTWTHTFFFEMHALLAFAATILTLVVKSYLDRRLGS